MSCETEINFPKISTIKSFWSIVLEKRLNYLILSKENDVTKPMSYKEVILKVYSKNVEMKVLWGILGGKCKYYIIFFGHCIAFKILLWFVSHSKYSHSYLILYSFFVKKVLQLYVSGPQNQDEPLRRGYGMYNSPVVMGWEPGCVQEREAETGQVGAGMGAGIPHNPTLTCNWLCSQTGQGILGL